MASKKIAIYPGTFDPVTYGHLDIINRALRFIDHLVIAVAENKSKSPVFSSEERVIMIKNEISKFNISPKKVEAKAFSGLLACFVREHNSSLILRGVRATSDFEYEFQMACMNAKLAPDIETIFLPASEKTHFIASRLVKEVIKLGGDVSSFVPPNVNQELIKKFM